MSKKVLAITGCAAGIAHTFMAAESLENAAKAMGYDVKVETHGTIGVENEFTSKEIQEADVIIIAADIDVSLDRFIDKKVMKTYVKAAIENPEGLIKQAFETAQKHSVKGETVGNVSLGKTNNSAVKHLMSGISYMIPMCISAGLLLAIANIFAFSADDAGNLVNWGFDVETASGLFFSKLFALGQIGFKLMIPLFAGFTAYSIADRPAIAPAMIGAYIINDPAFLGTEAGAGFLGAIIVAFLAGYIVKYLKQIPWPKIIMPIVPIMVIPLLATFAVFVIVFYGIGHPIASVMTALYEGLNSLSNAYAAAPILIGALIGAMIGFDLGGPVNKIALIFGTAVFTDTVAKYGIQGANFVPGTAAQAAISVAPLGAWLATKLFKNSFSSDQTVMGNNAMAMGMVGITEGAIPFAASKPLVFIPANVIGSAVAGALVTAFGAKFYGGLGSPLGTFVGYIEQPMPFLPWIFSICVGVSVTACMIGFGLKQAQKKALKEAEKEETGEVAHA
ncbi:PTS fructose transporter subunit IIC [Endozoicomonas numazuensis]|uniref:protein-N(pi)-phosphohistidine--D-fructose phosphotransferase n=1 Tax=Endozoicomonas numazuensis TaxID=1137799 RepID=A0A081NJ41_9GAMM|nr:fructose-specific PTS transporter subunit EIIC [Endozoicomonas numazuensis]KEQ18464.1 PTS fructose transporter subunit IIB [Endozoicomonas numazuensis]